MASDDRDDNQQPGSDPAQQDAAGLLRSFGNTIWPVIVASGGLLGFVALAGSAIVWTRVSAAEVPPDQVVAIYPRGALIGVAAAFLLLFGLAGLLATGFCYLVDSKARATIGMTRGLLTVLAVEGMVVLIFLAPATSEPRRELASTVFLLCLLGAFWATVFFEDDDRPNHRREMPEIRRHFVLITVCTSVVVIGASIIAAIIFGRSARMALVAIGLIALVPSAWAGWKFRDGISEKSKKSDSDSTDRVEYVPFTVPFTRRGMRWIGTLVALAAILPAIILSSLWLFGSLAVAVLLFIGLWRAAVVPKKTPLWFGFAVFVSVPLFGTLTWMAQNVVEPQVQPMALIRKSDSATEYIQGLFVAETDDRVYFASIETEGCSSNLTHKSGRLLWVPKAEIAAIAIGPFQSVSRARQSALEMSFALSPGAQSQGPSGPELTVTDTGSGAPQQPPPRRLETSEAAVQPNFGRGLRVVPQTAVTGGIVNLTMSSPNAETHGFGQSRNHRTVRVGGVPAEIVKEQAQAPWEAEYVATNHGKTLSLSKDQVYVRAGKGYAPVGPDAIPSDAPIFVRLDDPSVLVVNDNGLADEGFLRVEAPDARAPVKLVEGKEEDPPSILLRGESRQVRLKSALFRQAWHEDDIKFRVPSGATSGAVTIECSQLTTSPLLRVPNPPKAKIVVRMVPGSGQIELDGSRSRSGTGSVASWRWTVQGLYAGRGPRLDERLTPRLQPYVIRLNVKDQEGESGATQLILFRLPSGFSRVKGVFEPDAQSLTSLRHAVRRAVKSGVAESLAVESGSPGSTARGSLDGAFGDAASLRRNILSSNGKRLSEIAPGLGGLTIHTLVFGPKCASAGRAGKRFDVLIMGPGVQLTSPRRCPPLRSQTTRQLLAPG